MPPLWGESGGRHEWAMLELVCILPSQVHCQALGAVCMKGRHGLVDVFWLMRMLVHGFFLIFPLVALSVSPCAALLAISCVFMDRSLHAKLTPGYLPEGGALNLALSQPDWRLQGASSSLSPLSSSLALPRFRCFNFSRLKVRIYILL